MPDPYIRDIYYYWCRNLLLLWHLCYLASIGLSRADHKEGFVWCGSAWTVCDRHIVDTRGYTSLIITGVR